MLKKKVKKSTPRRTFNERMFHTILGSFFIALQAVVILYQLASENYIVFYWFCNHILLILGISFLLGRDDLVKACINVGLIPQLFWAADFFVKLITGDYLSGMTRYAFESSDAAGFMIPMYVHLFSTFIALGATYRKRPVPQTLAYSALYLAILYTLSYSFTPLELNANCVFRPCSLTTLWPDLYTFFWPFLVFLVVVVPTFLIQQLLYRFSLPPKIKPNKRKV